MSCYFYYAAFISSAVSAVVKKWSDKHNKQSISYSEWRTKDFFTSSYYFFLQRLNVFVFLKLGFWCFHELSKTTWQRTERLLLRTWKSQSKIDSVMSVWLIWGLKSSFFFSLFSAILPSLFLISVINVRTVLFDWSSEFNVS